MNAIEIVRPNLPSNGIFKPASAAQRMWLESKAQFLLGGGSCGSLKTSTAIIDGCTEYDNPNMHTIMFRKSLAAHNEAIRISRDWFTQHGASFEENCPIPLVSDARYNATSHVWRWPWGSTFQFAFCEKDEDVYAHQSQSYSCILWDESTREASESMVRFMFTRLRSIDPSLFLRVRCGTNPGGQHADWQMKLFLGGVCPHCEPPVREPGKIYHDAAWPSDGRSLGGKTTQFVPSLVTDHNLLGEDYIENVHMQRAATAKALLEGCWRALEGRYYDIWDPERMVVPRAAVRDKWYWQHWVGCDYGFSGSSAVAHLFARDPDTDIIYRLDGYVSKREPVCDFARSIYERFAKRQDDQEQARKLTTVYLSPDAWNNRGDLHTLAGQMNEVLREHGLFCVPARNDRAGGSQLIYRMLREGKILIADTGTDEFKLFRSAIESAEHDPDRPEAYLNIPNDPRSDERDAFRYGIYSKQPAGQKPEKMRIQERIEKELQSGDLTSAMFRIGQIRDEEKKRAQPKYYARTGSAVRRQIAEWERRQLQRYMRGY